MRFSSKKGAKSSSPVIIDLQISAKFSSPYLHEQKNAQLKENLQILECGGTADGQTVIGAWVDEKFYQSLNSSPQCPFKLEKWFYFIQRLGSTVYGLEVKDAKLVTNLKIEQSFVDNFYEGYVEGAYSFKLGSSSAVDDKKGRDNGKFPVLNDKGELEVISSIPVLKLKEVHFEDEEETNLKPSKLAAAKILAKLNCRHVTNAPGNLLGPDNFKSYLKRLCAQFKGLSLKIIDEAALIKLGAGGIVGVGKGSSERPFLAHITYKNDSKNKKKVDKIALVGKSVTFDTGGYCLKGPSNQKEMQGDKGGGAAVIGALAGIAELGLDLEVEAFLPVVENMISGGSFRVGDVLTMLSGKTVEVLNTDAEGRLILADALTYAQKNRSCKTVVNLATLTGACVVALGFKPAGLFSRTPELIAQFENASLASQEPVWNLPLYDHSKLKSKVADIANIGQDSYGGAIMAANFLAEFVEEDTRWAHLDIAGPALVGDKCMNGFGAKLILEYLSQL